MRRPLIFLSIFAVFVSCHAAPSSESKTDKNEYQIFDAFKSKDLDTLLQLFKEEQQLYANMRKSVHQSLEYFIHYVQDFSAYLASKNVPNEYTGDLLNATVELLNQVHTKADSIYKKWTPLENHIITDKNKGPLDIMDNMISWSFNALQSVNQTTNGDGAAINAGIEILNELFSRYYNLMEDCDEYIEEGIQTVEGNLQNLIKRYKNMVEELKKHIEIACLQGGNLTDSAAKVNAAENCRQHIWPFQNELQYASRNFEREYKNLLEKANAPCFATIAEGFNQDKGYVMCLINRNAPNCKDSGEIDDSFADNDYFDDYDSNDDFSSMWD